MKAGHEHLLLEDGRVVVPAEVAEPLLRFLMSGFRKAQRDNAGGRMSGDLGLVLRALQVAAIREADRRDSVSGTSFADSSTMGVAGDGRETRAGVLTSADAARRLGCSDRAVRKACERARIAAAKVGRAWLIDERDLEAFRFGDRRKT